MYLNRCTESNLFYTKKYMYNVYYIDSLSSTDGT